MIEIRETTLREANAYVEELHRHHGKVVGHKWSLAACARRAKREGYAKIITFILQSEPGTSLRAAGWTLEAAKAGKPRWNKERYATKPVQLSLFPSKQPPAEYKQRWAKALNQKEDTTT